MRQFVDINCDLGECDELHADSIEHRIMPLISSCNVACGAHAGSESVMRAVLKLAAQHQVAVGAHVSYEDRQNFGRVTMPLQTGEFADLVVRQTVQLNALSEELAAKIQHIKLHGALYHDVNHDEKLAAELVDLIRSQFGPLPIVAMSTSRLMEACASKQHPCLREAFADRRYANPLRLAPRADPNALLTADQATGQVAKLVHGILPTESGEVPIEFDTLCIHSDTPGALELAQSVKKSLAESGVDVRR